MSKIRKTLYLWDLGGTLFNEKWNIKKTGFNSYDDWIENMLGKSVSAMTPEEYEGGYEIPYKEGWYFDLKFTPDTKQVLAWTSKHGVNEGVTSGMHQQMDWRAKYLNPRLGYDIRDLIPKTYSAFDFGSPFRKNSNFYKELLEKRYSEGFRAFVYTEDNKKYCEEFLDTTKKLSEAHKDFLYRLYFLHNDNKTMEESNTVNIKQITDVVTCEKKYVL